MNNYLRQAQSINFKWMYYGKDLRKDLTQKYAWAIPSDEALEVITKYSPIIELGAGTGYWNKLLKDAGCKTIAFDKYKKSNHYGHKEFWTDVFMGDETVLPKFNMSINLFISWPPYDNPMAFNCLNNFKGKYIIYIGESWGGCTGSDAFHRALSNNWEQEDEVDIPVWDNVYDRLYVYKRR